MLMLPMIMLLALLAWKLAARSVARRIDLNVPDIVMKNRFIKTSALLTFLVYPGLGVKIFSVFKCRQIENAYYFIPDMNQRCYEGSHLILTGLSITFLVLYVLGLPGILFWRPFVHRRMIKQRFDKNVFVDPNIQARMAICMSPTNQNFGTGNWWRWGGS